MGEANMQNGRVSGLIEFWDDYVQKKGLVKKPTAQSRSTAVSKVMELLGDDDLDLATLDIEDALTRFENLAGSKYSPQTLTAYKGRFKSAVRDYLAFVEDPSGWKPGLKSRSSRSAASEKSKGRAGSESSSVAGQTPGAPIQDSHAIRLLEHTFPVRRDVIAVLKLPLDLTAQEAERVGAFVAALAMPENSEAT